MEGEARVLQQRVQVRAIDGGRVEPDEGVGRQYDEQREDGTDEPLHAQHARFEAVRQIAAEGRNAAAEDGQDEDPQQHGAFMVPPDAGDLVDHRLGGMAVLINVDDREIGRDEGVGQRREGSGEQDKLQACGTGGHRHQAGIVQLRAVQTEGCLGEGNRHGEHENEMAKLGDHSPVSFHWPDALSASATSGGM